MLRLRLNSSITLPFLALMASCGGDTDPGHSIGGLQLSLELVGGAQIDEVTYEITGNDMPPMGGTIDTSAPGATASVEVFGIPPGDGYLVEMTATSVDGGTTCEGSTRFDVGVGQVTSVMVMLNCKPRERFGGVRVNGRLNVCAELTKAVVSPLQTSVGFEIDVSAQASDAEGHPISSRWTPSDSFANPIAAVTTYTCDGPGTQTITIEVSDDAFKDCIDSWSVEVHCAGEAPPFVAAPPVTVSGLSRLADCESEAAFTHAETEPWIAVNPTNPDNIVGAWMQDAVPVTRGHVAGVTFDGGASWESVVIPGLSRCSGAEVEQASDPWLAFTTNGDLYSAALSTNGPGVSGPSVISVNKSVDGGLTWSDPITIDAVESPALNDKESITADPVDPCTVYVTWTRFKDLGAAGFPTLLLVSRTTDCGESWSEPSVIDDTEIWRLGLQIVAMPDGSLRAFSAGDGTLAVQQSTDQGDTWSERAVVANLRRDRPFTTDGGSRVRSGSILFDVAVDQETGHLYAVWEQLFVPGAFPVQVAFSSSTDGGLTWSVPIRIDQTPSSGVFLLDQAFLPSVEVADGGTLGVTYYNFQNAILGAQSSLTDHWFVHCNPTEVDCNDASSWANNELRLTSEAFNYLLAPVFQNALFLGDYVGLTTSGNDFFAFFSVTTPDDPANAVFVPIRAR